MYSRVIQIRPGAAMTPKILILLVLLTALSFSCDSRKAASHPEPRGKQTGGPARACVPEAELLAANIVQGTQVLPGDEDAKAVMMVFSNGELCTGAAISENVILTAAHCVVKGDPSNTSVMLYPSLSCESGFNRAKYSIPAVKIIVHEDYNPKVEANLTSGDLALVVLATKLPAGYPIYKIAAPSEVIEDVLLLYGYGKTGSNEKGAGILRNTTVQKYFKDEVNKKVKIDQQNAPGICQGDSGGPSLVMVGGELKILGVNSYVTGDSKDVCNRESYQVLVWSYDNWLQEKLKTTLLPKL